jgi:hypothetical protein
VKKLFSVVMVALCSSSAFATEMLSFIAPEGTVTKYHSATTLGFTIPKFTSSNSDGSNADTRIGNRIQQNLDGYKLEIIDDFTDTVGTFADNPDLMVNTEGKRKLNTSTLGATTSIEVPYRCETVYQSDGAIQFGRFVYDTSFLKDPYTSIFQAQQSFEEKNRNARIARLYGLDLELGQDVTLPPVKALGELDPDINLTSTYKFAGRDADNHFLFDVSAQSSLVSKTINQYGTKIFFKLMPGVGTGKISFLEDGRLLFEEYTQVTDVIYTYIFVIGKITSTYRFEGTISFERHLDVIE